jgi:hypothetical protein
VSVDEIVRAVDGALGGKAARCPAADVDGNGRVTINEVLQAVARAMRGC